MTHSSVHVAGAITGRTCGKEFEQISYTLLSHHAVFSAFSASSCTTCSRACSCCHCLGVVSKQAAPTPQLQKHAIHSAIENLLALLSIRVVYTPSKTRSSLSRHISKCCTESRQHHQIANLSLLSCRAVQLDLVTLS